MVKKHIINHIFVKEPNRGNMKELKVIIVDDNAPFRSALKKLLEEEYKHTVIAEAESGEEFLSLKNMHLADIIFMDLFMPGKNGKEVTEESLLALPSLKFIAVTMHADKAYTQELIETGFKGTIAKPKLFTELPEALETVMNNSFYFPDFIKP